ncbi:BPTI/Kunitz domain-containing protein [Kryptolebias marmoratus]|uniref:Si:dkeyp-73b11.8 n=1 Tax=Kryptolebias marmoratus TaxID=37003 RepID=A0A3Q3GNN6_KRYMA|nr:BPTI/Kunitz domain-containing protein [Kryptolebias marmoratus]
MKNLLVLGIVLSTLHIVYSQTNPEAFCKEPSDAGPGTNFSFSFFYDPSKDECRPFFYGGEGGNRNRFRNERECIRGCSPNAEYFYPMDVTKACHFKHSRGTCSGNFLRYYYDSARNKCKKFLWTGCFGNGNRFFDSESCNATCAGIHDDSDDPEEDEPNTPIAIICVVLLAVIVVAIIVMVIVLTVQSKKKKGSKKTAKDKHSDPQTEAALQGRGIEMT